MCSGLVQTTKEEFLAFLKNLPPFRLKKYPEWEWHYLLCCLRGDALGVYPSSPPKRMDPATLRSACKGLSAKKRAMVFAWFGLVPS